MRIVSLVLTAAIAAAVGLIVPTATAALAQPP